MLENDKLLDSKIEELKGYLPNGKPIGITFETHNKKYLNP